MRDLESFVSGYISIGFTNKGICVVLLKERICKKLGLFGRKCLTYLGKTMSLVEEGMLGVGQLQGNRWFHQ